MGIYEQWKGLTNSTKYHKPFLNQSDDPNRLKPHLAPPNALQLKVQSLKVIP
jgi:hypothetical protein